MATPIVIEIIIIAIAIIILIRQYRKTTRRMVKFLYLLLLLIVLGICTVFIKSDGEYLGGGYTFDGRRILSENPKSFDIPPEIEEYNYDSDFIIVHQNSENVMPSLENISKEYDSFHGIHRYYIIAKKTHKMYGPMTYSEFQRTKSRLGIELNFV